MALAYAQPGGFAQCQPNLYRIASLSVTKPRGDLCEAMTVSTPSLSPPERLRCYARLIAETLGVSAGTVKSHASRGLARLRELLDESGEVAATTSEESARVISRAGCGRPWLARRQTWWRGRRRPATCWPGEAGLAAAAGQWVGPQALPCSLSSRRSCTASAPRPPSPRAPSRRASVRRPADLVRLAEPPNPPPLRAWSRIE